MPQTSAATMSFNLQGDGATITYVESQGAAHGPTSQLTYQREQVNRSFTGDEIRQFTIEIGRLLRVILRPNVGGGTETLNLLLPEIDFSQASSPQVEVKTLAILGNENPNIRRPQRVTYQVLDLKGTATS